ncbi:DJ-1/PfpI family protein [Cognatiluteimonas profundi]|uniref:DJ-1/PfpI family protein n=1 Tax=Cognatiluteimonas profundi TaxID=2594501 RepID=UPI0018EF3505|nr:DJ-1/PfpI family protein [Lysobacter profundi]
MRTSSFPLRSRSVVAALALLCTSTVVAADPPAIPALSAVAGHAAMERIAPWRSRFGRSRPVIAIIGNNSGTELVDFVIPYGVLMASDAADVITVATHPGPLTMRPALTLQAQTTARDFNARYPDGADYVIVPAMVDRNDPVLLGWIAGQSRRGATTVSICDGALANAGVSNGHVATAHWATESLRAQQYPGTHWVKDTRYVADGRVVSSAGISAAMPTSLALVEAIAGHARAAAVAAGLGVADWSAQHDSDAFQPRLGVNLRGFAATNYTNHWFHSMQHVGVPVTAGMDEIALAITADAYSRTGRSHAMALAASKDPVTTRHGLVLLPDRVLGDAAALDVVLPALQPAPSAQAFDTVLASIAGRYGRNTAFGVALDFEYPGFHN